MKKRRGKAGLLNIYYYLAVVLSFNILVFAAPVLSVLGDPLSQDIHLFLSPFCHQLFERSMCMSSAFEIGNCDLDSGFVHRFPVCSRDMSFYLTMLLGGLAYVLLGKRDEKEIPSLMLLVGSMLPLAIDGITQLLGIRESSNFLRILTGGIAGFAIPFFLIPIMNRLQRPEKKV